MNKQQASDKLFATDSTKGPLDAADLLACLKVLGMTAAVWQMDAIMERLAEIDALDDDNGQLRDTLATQEQEIKDLEARIKDLEAELDGD